jgi:hypothetical protein
MRTGKGGLPLQGLQAAACLMTQPMTLYAAERRADRGGA